MRVALITGYYLPEVGYQEVNLAQALSRSGHEVKIFTSSRKPPHFKKVIITDYSTGLSCDEKYGYEILRLRPTFKIRRKVFSNKLLKEVLVFNPELVFAIALAQFFPLALFKKSFSQKFRIVSFFGDSKEYFRKDTTYHKIRTAVYFLSFRFLKSYIYRKALKHSSLIVFNHPETENLFQSFVGNKYNELLGEKKLNLNLGYNPDEFYFSIEEREKTRIKYGIKEDEIVIITTTVVRKGKKLEEIISAINSLHKKGYPLKYILAGFRNDDYGNELRNYIKSTDSSRIIVPLNILNHDEIRELYCGSDIGLWQKATISIQEGMGTGLPVIIENQPIVTHLIKNGYNGWSFDENNLTDIIESAVLDMIGKNQELRSSWRSELAGFNAARLSYDKITEKIIQTVNTL